MKNQVIIEEIQNQYRLVIPSLNLYCTNRNLLEGYKEIREKEECFYRENIAEIGLRLKISRYKKSAWLAGSILILFYVILTPFYLLSSLSEKIDRAFKIDKEKENKRLDRFRGAMRSASPYLKIIKSELNDDCSK